MASGAASSAVSVGETMASLPQTVEAVTSGGIGFGHLVLMARTAEAVKYSATGSGFDEAPLLQQAEQHSVSRFRRDCAHARHAHDAERVLAAHVHALRARHLTPLPPLHAPP